MPYRKIKVHPITYILHLPSGQRVICYSWDGTFRVLDLETGTQTEEWEDKDPGVADMALSPSSKTIATGHQNGVVKLWDIKTGKVIKTLTGHTKEVRSVCWSSDGGRVVSGSDDGILRVWDVKSGETILGPIKATEFIRAVCYSPDGKIIAATGDGLKIWDASSGELLKTLQATWSQTVIEAPKTVHVISLSPNERILAGTRLVLGKTAYLWNLETNQLIKTLYHTEDLVYRAQPIFSADRKFLVTSCYDGYLYQWDVSAIVKEAGLPLDILDATPRPAPKLKGTPRIPPGFFDDDLRKANERIRLSQSHGPYHHPTPTPHQRTFNRFSSLWRNSNSHRETDHHARPQSHPLSRTRNLGILRRRDASDIELQEVEVPYTAGKPRNYHARKKPARSSPKVHATAKPSASSQLPSTATTSTLSAVTGTAEASGIPSRPHTTGVGWCARFVGCICCASVQNADGHH
ncbi:WD40-repeat-containing domain protein [Suillus bovinus]|uniref:WD40-repeat-containing domain protein n=1 Tax=Suillus bovinus TaxID=48563 RepID=UPI001B8695DF|nr:WD40-repeat-containing domain protein [Suillus bovinus]KAG2135351.1 WD40-repeat-containing domain protein [Suillus bovinus]